MVKSRASVITNLVLVLAMVLGLVGCGKKEEPPAAKGAGPPAEVKRLSDETKRYAETLKSQPAGSGVTAEQLSKLTVLLDQLLRHMEERAQVRQQGGDVSKPEAAIAADLAQVQEIQETLPTVESGSGAAPAAGQDKPTLDLISENLAKITQIVQQGKELAAVVRRPKDQSGLLPGSSVGESSEGTPASGSAAQGESASEEPPEGREPSPAPSALQLKTSPVQKGGAMLAQVEGGYASVHMEAWPSGNRLRVKVNGLLVGAYDNHASVTLDPFLKTGRANTVTFTFDRPGTGQPGVVLSVKTPGSGEWIKVLQFVSSKDKLEDSFEVPFVGAKK